MSGVNSPLVRERWLFEVRQGGMVVAEGDCPDSATAIREAAHYCMMYGQDGPVEGKVFPEEAE